MRVVYTQALGDLHHEKRWLGRLNTSESYVLMHLYLHKGDLVSKDTLLDIGWPGKVVTPNSLNMAIKNIRSCFEKINCDDVIITHVKRGYSWNPAYLLIIEDIEKDENADKGNDITHPSTSESSSTALANDIERHKHRSYDSRDEGATSRILPPRVRRFAVGNIINNLMLSYNFSIVLIMLIIMLAIFYRIYWTDLACYEISSAVFCGVGDFHRELINKPIEEGHYLFGYDGPGGAFYYVKN